MLDDLVAIIAIPFIVAGLAFVLPGKWAGRLALLAPVGVLVLVAPLWPRVMDGASAIVPLPWMPGLFSAKRTCGLGRRARRFE
jgi:hypothetical protein